MTFLYWVEKSRVQFVPSGTRVVSILHLELVPGSWYPELVPGILYPEPETRKQIVTALADFEARSEDEVTFYKGDKVHPEPYTLDQEPRTRNPKIETRKPVPRRARI